MIESLSLIALGSLFGGVVGYKLHQLIIREKLPDMIEEETHKYIKDLESRNASLNKSLKVAIIQIDIAMQDSKSAHEERNELARLLLKRKK